MFAGNRRSIPVAESVESEIFFEGAVGHGSVGTCIRTFNAPVKSTGADITYIPDTTNGDRFRINTRGLYGFQFNDGSSGATQIQAGFSVNAHDSELAVAIEGTGSGRRLAMYESTNGNTNPISISTFAYLKPGDIVRAHTNGTANRTQPTYVSFRIVKIS